MSENTTEEDALGRRISVLAFGDTADEIEFAALDGARKVFGDSIALEVVRDYKIHDVKPGGALAAEAGGKTWHARVTVRERT